MSHLGNVLDKVCYFRRALAEYETDRGGAIRELRIKEPKLMKVEVELERAQKESKILEKKNRKLQEVQQQLELDQIVSIFGDYPYTDNEVTIPRVIRVLSAIQY